MTSVVPGTIYNPRYVAFARAHGRHVEAQMTADRTRWPGGLMAGFIIWIGQRWEEWDAETGHRPGGHDKADHAAFDEWLEVWVDLFGVQRRSRRQANPEEPYWRDMLYGAGRRRS